MSSAVLRSLAVKSFAVWFNPNIAIEGEHFGPNINLVYWYCLMPFAVFHRNRKAFWSDSLVPICMNMPSISADTASGCSRKRSSNPNILLRRSGLASKREFKDIKWKIEAVFATRLIFPGLFGFTTGWWGKNQTLIAWGFMKTTVLT